jgi:hypothetical protein
MVYVGMSVVLGILTGTVLADGSWRSMVPATSHDSIQVSSSVSESPTLAATQIAPAVPLPAQAVAVANAQASSALKPAALTTSATHRSTRVLGAGKRHRAGHRGHGRHRIHANLIASAPAKMPSVFTPPKAEVPAITYSFSIQGELTVFDFDPSTGIIQTYEGENFALDKTATAAGAVTLPDYPATIHYSCDQAGSCTLIRGGVVVLNAKRTS